MALICAECEIDIGPSRNMPLPARQGVLSHPVLPSAIWIPGKNESKVIAPVEANLNLSICLECFDQKISPERKPFLEKVYSAVNTETGWRQAKQNKSPWETSSPLFDDLMEKIKLIRVPECLNCGTNIPKPGEPHILNRWIDSVKSTSYQSHFFGESSYGLGGLEEGFSTFLTCLPCFDGNFPKAAKSLSEMLRGIDPTKPKSEFYIDQAALEALSKEDPAILGRFRELFNEDPRILPDQLELN